MLTPNAFFDLQSYEHAALFAGLDRVWEALPRLDGYLRECLATLDGPRSQARVAEGAIILNPEQVILGEGTIVEAGALIAGPTIIGRNCEVRHGAYIRGGVVTGDGCIVGHASELKNAILLDHSHAPHFAYVGDSILGNRVNLGAGTRLSNLPMMSEKDPATGKRPTVRLEIDGRLYDTGLAKLGTILGDDAQTGCNVVTNPGCLIGKRTLIYALLSLRKGYYPPDHIVKLRQQVEVVARR